MSNVSCPGISAFGCSACVCVDICRLLLMLSAVSLLTAPVTQGIWLWDRVLSGGQDFEFGILMVLLTLCLVFLLAGNGKQRVELSFSIGWLIAILSGDRASLKSRRGEPISPYLELNSRSTASVEYLTSLQI